MVGDVRTSEVERRDSMPMIGSPAPESPPELDIDSYPPELREPVKRVWALVSVLTAVAAGVLELGNLALDVVPETAKPYVTTVVVAVPGAVVILGKVQAFLARNRVYPYAVAAELAKATPKALPPA